MVQMADYRALKISVGNGLHSCSLLLKCIRSDIAKQAHLSGPVDQFRNLHLSSNAFIRACSTVFLYP